MRLLSILLVMFVLACVSANTATAQDATAARPNVIEFFPVENPGVIKLTGSAYTEWPANVSVRNYPFGYACDYTDGVGFVSHIRYLIPETVSFDSVYLQKGNRRIPATQYSEILLKQRTVRGNFMYFPISCRDYEDTELIFANVVVDGSNIGNVIFRLKYRDFANVPGY